MIVSDSPLVTVLFWRSPAPRLSAALLASRGARRLVECSEGGTPAYLAEYGRTGQQASAAAILLRVVGGWRGTVVTVGGRIVSDAWGALATVERVLRCFAEAESVPDRRAHCCMVSDTLFEDRRRLCVFPCRHVVAVFPTPVDGRHPASVSDQISGRAVAAQCDWCPVFDASKFDLLPESRISPCSAKILPAS